MGQLRFVDLTVVENKIRIETTPCYDCAVKLSKEEVLSLIEQLQEIVQKLSFMFIFNRQCYSPPECFLEFPF